LVGNSRTGCAFDVVFLSPEHEDYPTIDVPDEDRGSAVAAMRVPSNRSDSGSAHCRLELRQSNRRGSVPVTEQAWKQSVRAARLDLASMAKVGIAAVEKRFPEGGSRQLYADVQWMNSSWWGLELGQTYQEKQEAVAMSGTQQLYYMVSSLADLFNDEFCVQVPVHSDRNEWEEYRVAPKVSLECTQERDVDGEDGDGDNVLSSPLWDECVRLQTYICEWDTWVCTGKDRRRIATWAEHWAQMLTEVRFREDCRTIHTLTSIVVVSPHGSVEDERQFLFIKLREKCAEK
jgi:hypothetical protein